MYKSRLHFSNGVVEIALDSQSGEILELHDSVTGENFIKNSMFSMQQPFYLICTDGKRLAPFHTDDIIRNRELACEIASSEDGVTVRYRFLNGGDGTPVPVDVSYTVRFDGIKLYWNLNITDSPELSFARFPCLNGIYLGETWEDDVLYYPTAAGRRYENPVEYFARPQSIIEWRWQEYRYSYRVDSCCGRKDDNGMYTVSSLYPGGLSMSFFDYSDNTSGLYFASHGKSSSLVTLGASTPGPLKPCMCFFAQYEITGSSGCGWSSPDVVTAIHGGDWHEGADIYREYKESRLGGGLEQPEWFKNGVGLLAHYDFRYQNGGVVHKYSDIPGLKEQAKRYGLDHLLFAGWHIDGFDNGFPQYYFDPELGTVDELRDGCRSDDGVHVSFYINSRIANMKYKDVSDRIVICRDGKPLTEQYGNKDITFGVMCPSSAGWQGELLDIVERAKNEYGVDGVYLDQLSGPAKYCFSKEHGHEPGDWCKGYKHILDSFAPLGLATMGEFVCDEFGPCAANFDQSFYALRNGVFPELYRYTFPDHILVDALYPSKNLAMRPVFVEQNSDRLMQTAFADGMYFWIYDLVDDNTFERDPEQRDKLISMIRLRRFWLDNFGRGRFLDTVGLGDIPDGFILRRYETDKGQLIASVNKNGADGSVILLDSDADRAVAYTSDSPDGFELKTEKTDSGLKIDIPHDEYSIIFVDQVK